MTSVAITIGGAVTSDQIRSLASTVYEMGGGWDYDAGFEDVKEAENWIRNAIAEADSLTVMFDTPSAEAMGDLVETLKAWGKPHSISQDCGLDGCSVSMWLPGWERPREWGEVDGLAVLNADQIRAHLAAGTLEDELVTLTQCDNFPFKLEADEWRVDPP